MPTLFDGWTDNPQDPGRIRADDPRVLALLARITPGATATDLGGSFSLNLHLCPDNLVLRVHRPFVSRRRLLAEQALREQLSSCGLMVPVPIRLHEGAILSVGAGSQRRLAEIEPFLDTVEPAPTITSYRWLFAQMGDVHRILATLSPVMPRSLAATWGTPKSLRRWIGVTKRAVESDPGASVLVAQAESLLPEIRRRWMIPGRLPQHLIHGDFRLGNLVRGQTTGELVLFDTGFADVRPRIWEIAYGIGFMELALNDATMHGIWTDRWQDMVSIYEESRGESLTSEERSVLPAMAAIALIHTLAHAGYMADPATIVMGARAFLQTAAQLLEA